MEFASLPVTVAGVYLNGVVASLADRNHVVQPLSRVSRDHTGRSGRAEFHPSIVALLMGVDYRRLAIVISDSFPSVIKFVRGDCPWDCKWLPSVRGLGRSDKTFIGRL